MLLFEGRLMMEQRSVLNGLISMKLIVQCVNYTKRLKPCFSRGRTPRLGEYSLSGFIFTVILFSSIKMVI